MKPKHQYHLSQRAESVYGAQSWKEKRLLYESTFVTTDKWNLALKNDRKKSFSYEIKALISFAPMIGMSL